MMVASFPRGGLSLGTGGALADTLAKAVLCLVNCSPKTTGHDVAVIARRCQGSFRLSFACPFTRSRVDVQGSQPSLVCDVVMEHPGLFRRSRLQCTVPPGGTVV